MLKNELLEVIANGENSGVEFKRDDIRPEQLAKEIVALANFMGGVILLGVEDGGIITGIQRQNCEEWVMNVFRDKVHPMILPYYEEILMDDNRRIAAISFPQGISKPYVLRHGGNEEIYIRIGSTSQRATREQQAHLFASGGMLHTEMMPVPGSSLSSLDRDRLRSYLSEIIEDPEIPQTEEEWNERLMGLGFLIETAMKDVVCTIAGLVLFGIAPRRYLPQSGLRVMVFSGEDKTYRALLDEVIDAPAVGRFVREGSLKRLVDEGAIEMVTRALRPFISQESDEIDENMRKEKSWFYPWSAVREVIINGIAHRDWTRSVDIEIVVYSNRIEVNSPGSLQNSMTIEKMKAGQRSPRNPTIVSILRDYGYVDARGMGIRTKVIPLMIKENHVEPIFEATEDFVKVILYRVQEAM